jgi:phospholipase/lecithinase/hemolysin
VKSLRPFLVSCVLVALGAADLRAGPITQLVAFGDSLTDTGNVFTATGGLAPASPPYFNGRFSNGPVWVEVLASRLGVPAPAPVLLGGTDYAFAGAETGSGSSTPFPGLTVPNMGTQIALYLAANKPQPGQLLVLWGGANDFLDGQTNPAVPVANLSADITALAQAGGKTFLVPNLPPLGDTPEGRSLPPAQRAGLNALSLAFDALLNPALDNLQASLGITILRPDVLGLVENIEANPGAFGLTNVTDQAKAGPVGFPGPVVPNPDQYLFWDPIHPTAAGHRLIAEEAAFVFAAPEPSSLALLLVGTAFVVGARRRSRRARGAT